MMNEVSGGLRTCSAVDWSGSCRDWCFVVNQWSALTSLRHSRVRGLPEAPQLPYLSAPPTAITHRHTGFCFPEPRDKVCLLKVVFRVSSVIPSLDYLVTCKPYVSKWPASITTFGYWVWVIYYANCGKQTFYHKCGNWGDRAQSEVAKQGARSKLRVPKTEWSANDQIP